MDIKIISPKDRKKHGKIVDGILYLNEGVCYNQKSLNNVTDKSLYLNYKLKDNSNAHLWE